MRRIDTIVLGIDVAVKVILSAKAFGVVLASMERTVELRSIRIVSRQMAHQVLSVLEALIAHLANMISTEIWLVRS